MRENRQIITSVAGLLSRREVALFIGPDLPAAAAGAPGWSELAARLAARSSVPAGSPWPAIAERYVQRAGRRELVDWLDGQLPSGTVGTIYHELAALPVDTYISATYDNQLSLALAAQDRPPNRIIDDADLNFIRPERPTVVKLLGELGPGGRESLLVTAGDLQRLLYRRSTILEQAVRPAFTGKSLLILGQDPRVDLFRTLYYWALPQNSPLRRRAFAVWAGMEEWEKESWRQNELAIVAMDPMAFLAALKAELAGKPVEPPPSPETKQEVLPESPLPPSPSDEGDEDAGAGAAAQPPPPGANQQENADRHTATNDDDSRDGLLSLEQLPRVARTFTLVTLVLMAGFTALALLLPGQIETLGLVLLALLLTLVVVIVATLLAIRVLSPESGERLFQAVLRALPLVGRLAGAPNGPPVETGTDDAGEPSP